MPFKRGGRPTWYVGPLTAGGIYIPRMSTGVKDKQTATGIEAMLRTLPTQGYADLIEDVISERLKVSELYSAYNSPGAPGKLQALRDRKNDSLLGELIGSPAEYATEATANGLQKRRLVKEATGMYARLTDERAAAGLTQLLDLAPEGARLSWLKTPSNVTELYRRAILGEGGTPRKPNSVRRSLHRAVSEVLAHTLGRGAMLRVMADAKIPGENDERVVILTPSEIEEVLELADPEFRPVIGLALTTGIDRGVMLKLRVSAYEESTGTLSVLSDTKTSARPRMLILRGEPVLENSEYWLHQLTSGRRSFHSLVQFTAKEIRTRWEAVREAVHRPDVRWKDLRGTFATYYLQAGGDPRNLQHILGHSGMAMTLRYLRRVPVGNRELLRQAARWVARAEGVGALIAPVDVESTAPTKSSMDKRASERVLRITQVAQQVFEDPIKAARWMATESRALGSREPAALAAESEDGAQAVEEELRRIEHGVYL